MNGSAIDYQDADTALRGEAFWPDQGNGAGVLVVHEADGIGGNVRRHCALLAEQGYVAFAADLHGGGRVLAGDEMMAALARFRAEPALLRRRVRAGLDRLASLEGVDALRLAAIGYCFGGTAVLELARSSAPVRAVASFHGQLTTNAPAAAGSIRSQVAVFTGALDPLVPPADLAAFQDEMSRAGADWRLTIYGRALHSFTNIDVDALGDPRMAYDAAAHRDSWAATLKMLQDTIGR